MNRAELVGAVAQRAGIEKKDAEKAVDAVITSIQDALSKGDKVSLMGFGTFEVRDRAARKGRNPRSGAEIEIAATKVPVFRAGKTLKDAVSPS